MLPSWISTFWSLIQAPSTPRRVEVARLMACWMASSKLVCDVALSSVMRATDICTPFRSLFPGAFYYPRARKINPDGRGGATELLEFLDEHGVRGRLVRTARGLDGDRYRVGVFQRCGDGGSDRVTRGGEQAARPRLVVVDHPDLARAVLRHGGHVLDHEDGAVVFEGRHLRAGALLRPGAAELDLACLLLGLVRRARLLDLAAEVPQVPLQKDVPREEADHE